MLYGYKPILAYIGGAGLRFYRPSFYNTRVAIDVLYASGDNDTETLREGNTDGDAKRSAALVFTPRAQNLMFVQFRHSLKPIDMLQTELKMTAFFRAIDGAIDAGIDSSSSDPYLGTEVDLALNIRPLSDLGITLSGGLFWPSTLLEDYGDLEGLVRFEASFGL